MDVESLRIDLRRTQERLAQAEQIGDLAAIRIGEAREERLLEELRSVSIHGEAGSSVELLSPQPSGPR